MSAFPMYARCAQAQWRGLTKAERREIDDAWERKMPWELANIGHRSQMHIPLWTIQSPLCPDRYLLSIKEDA